MYALPGRELLRDDGVERCDGRVRGGVVRVFGIVGVHGVPGGQLLRVGGSRGGVGSVRRGHVPGDVGRLELFELRELRPGDLLGGGGERVLKLQRGDVLVVGPVDGVRGVRRGHLLVGRFERLHGLPGRDVPRVGGGQQLRELLGGHLLGGRGLGVRALCGGHVPSWGGGVKLRWVRRGVGVGGRGRVVVVGVRGVRGRIVLGELRERLHELRGRDIVGIRLSKRLLVVPRRELLRRVGPERGVGRVQRRLLLRGVGDGVQRVRRGHVRRAERAVVVRVVHRRAVPDADGAGGLHGLRGGVGLLVCGSLGVDHVRRMQRRQVLRGCF